MKRKWFSLAVIIILLSFAAVSCTRSASKTAIITPTLSDEVPFPVASQPPLMIDILAITQTAMAGGEVESIEDPVEGSVDEDAGETTELLITDEPTDIAEPTATDVPMVFPTSTLVNQKPTPFRLTSTPFVLPGASMSTRPICSA